VAKRVANATDAQAGDLPVSERLAARFDVLAPAEQRVARQLLEAAPEASLLSAAALAKQLGTSDATIVRTAKALGYAGLADLRRALVAENRNPPPSERLDRTLRSVSEHEILASALAGQHAALDAMARDVPSEDFERAVAVLAESERVVWRGVGPSAHLAAYAQVLTERIGKESRALTQAGTSFADELLTIRSTDAVVVLAYGRLQPQVRVLLERADSVGARVVVVTDNLKSAIRGAAVATLQSGRGVPGLVASHGTTTVLIEALVLGMAAANRAAADAALTSLNELRAGIAGRRIDVDTP
jgi:DNA-binding MurR/RpiR family transcriptional regulator